TGPSACAGQVMAGASGAGILAASRRAGDARQLERGLGAGGGARLADAVPGQALSRSDVGQDISDVVRAGPVLGGNCAAAAGGVELRGLPGRVHSADAAERRAAGVRV